jgi:hypothetical protein
MIWLFGLFAVDTIAAAAVFVVRRARRPAFRSGRAT